MSARHKRALAVAVRRNTEPKRSVHERHRLARGRNKVNEALLGRARAPRTSSDEMQRALGVWAPRLLGCVGILIDV